MHDRLVLARVQMPPRPFRLVIVKSPLRPAFRALPSSSFRMRQIEVNLSLLKLQFDSFHKPGICNPKDLLVQLSVLNGASPIRRPSGKLHPAWAEDRPMLGSNPSADSGTKTEAGCHHDTPFPSLSLPRDWYQSDKSRGSGGWPPAQQPTKNPEFPKIYRSASPPRRAVSKPQTALRQRSHFKRLRHRASPFSPPIIARNRVGWRCPPPSPQPRGREARDRRWHNDDRNCVTSAAPIIAGWRFP